MSRPRFIALLLVLITLAAYLPVSNYHFLNFDDDEYVTQNPVVQNGLTLSGLEWAFTTDRASNWHPLTWISHMLDCTFFGLNPGPQHLVNLLFHTANTVLLFLLFLRLTNQLWPAAFVAALFAWHPLHVESVAWIAERKDVLSTFFAILTLLSYAKYVQASSRRSYWLAWVLFLLGLLSKPMLVTLPCVMLLLDYWPLKRFSLTSFRFNFIIEKVPFFILTLASCVITFIAQRSGHAVVSLQQVSVEFRLVNAVTSAGRYLLKLVWPSPLAVFYPFEPIPPWHFVLSLAALIMISFGAWHMRNRNRCWLVGWLWFLGTLVPVIGLVQVGGAAMADRYSYIPSIGIFMAVAFGLDDFFTKFAGLKKMLPLVTTGSLAGCLAMMTWQLHFWRDTETLFRHAIAVTPANDKAHLNLAIALEQQGRYQEALAEYRETLRLAPDRHKVLYRIGCMLGDLGRHAEALETFKQALQFNPKDAFYHCAVGNELVSLGHEHAALKAFEEAERLKPDYAQPHLEAAKLLFKQGQEARAVDELRAAVKAEPDNFQTLATVAHYLAANQQTAARDGALALKLALKANKLSGQIQPMVWDTLGMAYAATGDFGHAVACAQQALKLAKAAGLKNLDDIQRRLTLYQNQQPWRETFEATNSSFGTILISHSSSDRPR